MPYTCKLDGNAWKLTKKGTDKALGTHNTKAECTRQMRAIYSSEARSIKNIVFEGYVYLPYNLDGLIEQSDDPIRVAINSQGGDFLSAISIHNKLRNSGKKIITYIDPFAISAGAVIALAGDEVYMPENGLLMFHSPAVELRDSIKDADELEKMMNGLRAAEDVLVKTLCAKTKKSEEDCRKIMKDETYYTANEALLAGIIDEIIPISRDLGKDFSIQNYNFPERIVNYIQEKQNMPLQEVCQQFAVKDEAELVAFINTLKANQPARPVEVSTGIINMVKNARKVQLQQLVTDGKLTPAVVNDLELTFLNENRIKADCQLKDDNQEFDKIIIALAKNDKVVNFGGTTGNQQPPAGDPPSTGKGEMDTSDRTLVTRMEKIKPAPHK